MQGFKKEVPIELGLRQGAPESCMLFNYWLDTVIRFALHDMEKEYPGAGIKFNYNIGPLPFARTDRPKRTGELLCGNGKVKAGPCDYSHDPCVEYT